MGTDYQEHKVSSVNPESVNRLLYLSEGKYIGRVRKEDKEFLNYLRNRRTLQWGGMADPLDEFERTHGVSLRLLEIFDQHDYPLSISTKGVWWTRDERYMELVRAHAHNWHWKISIITADPIKARAIEDRVDSPQERLKAIKRLADTGAHVTLRLRPYIVGLSDDWRDLIIAAKRAGADSVTVEYFCLEGRAQPELKERYTTMSRVMGYDMYEYYRTHSPKQHGYMRLNYALKADTIAGIKELAHRLGMRFYCSDAHHKGKSDFTCCCGVPPDWKVSKGQFTEALMIAKQRHRRGEEPLMYWSDISGDAADIFREVNAPDANGMNVARSTSKSRAIHRGRSVDQWLQFQWNNPKSGYSPVRYFGEPVSVHGIDDDGNIVYMYREGRGEENGQE